VNLDLTAHGTEVLGSWQEANDRRLGRALDRLPRQQQDIIQGAVPALAALAALLETDEETRNENAPRLPGANA
jgi:hypothetical protein